MFEKEKSITSTPTGSIQVPGPEPMKKHSQKLMSAALADVNQHYIERVQAEWQEAADLFCNINSTMLAADKIKFYQKWLRDFSRRRIEDADFAMKAARTLSNIEMKLSMGLVEKEDLQTAKVA
jgi:hypothetical protein